MTRVLCLVDGFNSYHAIDKAGFNHLKWLDYRKFFECFLHPGQKITDVFYFTTVAEWNPEPSPTNHRTYIKALRTVGVKTFRGYFTYPELTCKKCKKKYRKHQEKATDVNLAVHLVKWGMKKWYDMAIILSGDGDFIPAIKMVRTLDLPRQVLVILPIGLSNDRLKDAANFSKHMEKRHLNRSQLPNTITLKSGKTLCRPPEWK